MLLTLTNSIIQLQNQYNQSMFKMIMDMNLISVIQSALYTYPNARLFRQERQRERERDEKKIITLKFYLKNIHKNDKWK